MFLLRLQLNEFDFDEPTPGVSLSFRKQKQAKTPTQRKVASFDKIMNDITKVRFPEAMKTCPQQDDIDQLKAPLQASRRLGPPE